MGEGGCNQKGDAAMLYQKGMIIMDGNTVYYYYFSKDRAVRLTGCEAGTTFWYQGSKGKDNPYYLNTYMEKRR